MNSVHCVLMCILCVFEGEFCCRRL